MPQDSISDAEASRFNNPYAQIPDLARRKCFRTAANTKASQAKNGRNKKKQMILAD